MWSQVYVQHVKLFSAPHFRSSCSNQLTAVRSKMLTFLLISFLFISASSGVLLRDPKRFPCDDYDLFDPPVHVVPESDGVANIPLDHEIFAHQLVHQLNSRTNSIFKSLLVQLKQSKITPNGNRKLTFYQLETRCRNDGKKATSLIKCPYREHGKVLFSIACHGFYVTINYRLIFYFLGANMQRNRERNNRYSNRSSNVQIFEFGRCA